jgi:hypothetical protein
LTSTNANAMVDVYVREFCEWAWNTYARGRSVWSWTPEETVGYHREFIDRRNVLGKYTSQELLDVLFLYGCTDDEGTMIQCGAIERFAIKGPLKKIC